MLTGIHTNSLLAAAAAVAIDDHGRAADHDTVRTRRTTTLREAAARLLRALADVVDVHGAPRTSPLAGA